MRRAAAAAALLLAAAPAAAIDVLLRSPRAGEPAFGPITIDADVLSGEPVAEVVFRVDGEEVGRLERPPWRLTVDLGDDNAEHLFEVVARTAGGERASARVATPAVRVDDGIDLELQQLYVTVTGAAGYELALGRDRFRVFDGGREQQLVTFERGDAPLTAVVLLDTSISMRGARLATAIAGARAFLDGLRGLDEAKVVLFSDRRIHAAGFSRRAGELTAGLEAVAAGGGTALNDHLYYALRLLEGRQGRRVVIVLSDGIDRDSVLGADDVRWAARRSQAMVYWIRLRAAHEPGTYGSSWRSARQHVRELEMLERTVAESGGAVHPIAGVDGAEQAFGAILTELRSQYVLGYYPDGKRDDGRWSRVAVRVRGPYQVRTRDGYIDY